jgi:hypothetical protein
MDDELFARLGEREVEIRRRLEAGDIDDDAAAALRELVGDDAADDAGSQGERRLRITTDQLRRIVDEDVDIDVLRTLLDLSPSTELDDLIDVAADYAPDARALRRIGAAATTTLTCDQLRAIFDNDLDPAAIDEAASYGFDDPIAVAIELAEVTADPADLLRRLRGAGLDRLEPSSLLEIAEHDLDPDVLAAMMGACPDLDVATLIELCNEEIEPAALRRLRDAGIDLDVDRLTKPSVTVSLLNLHIGDRQVLVGGGRERVRRSGRVVGFYVGDVTINPGLVVDFAATLIGTLHIEPGAHVTVSGRVTGNIDDRGAVEEREHERDHERDGVR